MTHNTKTLTLHIAITVILVSTLVSCGGTEKPGDIEPVKDLPVPTVTAAADGASPESASPPQETANEQSAPPGDATPVDPAEPAANFSISGGVVGFCDTLTIAASGEYVLESCNRDGTTGTLEQTDLEILQNWRANFATFQLAFEDNPDGADSLTTTLTFNGVGSTDPDESQEQMIAEWFNGLFIRLWPQVVEAPPTPTPTEIGADGLCPNVVRPALVVAGFQDPANLTVIDPNTLAECNITLEQSPSGRIMTAAGNIYYPVFDSDAQTMTIWQLNPSGKQTPLAFTTVTMEAFGPFTYVVSDDGSKIAWARTAINPDLDPPVYRNDLWTANIDGSNQVTLQEQVENTQKRFVQPIRFSVDNSELFYASQPDELGFDFSGRYDNIYSIPLIGGEPRLVFACQTGDNPICIGDITPDGSALAYTQRDAGEVRVIGRDGNLLGTFAPPVTDYVGSAVFGPTGNLSFVSAIFSQASDEALPLPNPGYISFVEAPYTGEARVLLTNNSVVSLWEWLDENRLAYGSVDEVGNVGTSIVTLEGQTIELSPNYALAVLR